jgi:hypothetical protein
LLEDLTEQSSVSFDLQLNAYSAVKLDWKHYKHPPPKHVFNVYISFRKKCI